MKTIAQHNIEVSHMIVGKLLECGITYSNFSEEKSREILNRCVGATMLLKVFELQLGYIKNQIRLESN